MGIEFEVRSIWPQSPFSKSIPLCNSAWKKKKIRLGQPFLRGVSPDAQNIIHGDLNPGRQSHTYWHKPAHCVPTESPPWLPHLIQSHRTQNKHWGWGGKMQRPQEHRHLPEIPKQKECIQGLALHLVYGNWNQNKRANPSNLIEHPSRLLKPPLLLYINGGWVYLLI